MGRLGLLLVLLALGLPAWAGDAPAPSPAPGPARAPGMEPPDSAPPAASALPGAPLDASQLHVRVRTIAWNHSISFDATGTPSPDAWFDVELLVHAPSAELIDALPAGAATATTASGAVLAPLPAPLTWAQGPQEPVAEITCHLAFRPPETTATRLSISGSLRIAGATALRAVDLSPLGRYLGQWAEVQGMPGAAVHAYRLDGTLWLQFSPTLGALFHGMEYADAGGADIDIPDWDQSDGPQPAYTNDVEITDQGRVTISYIDPARSVLLPFHFVDLPLDGAPLERTAAPPHPTLQVPSRPVDQPPTRAGAGGETHF